MLDDDCYQVEINDAAGEIIIIASGLEAENNTNNINLLNSRQNEVIVEGITLNLENLTYENQTQGSNIMIMIKAADGYKLPDESDILINNISMYNISPINRGTAYVIQTTKSNVSANASITASGVNLNNDASFEGIWINFSMNGRYNFNPDYTGENFIKIDLTDNQFTYDVEFPYNIDNKVIYIEDKHPKNSKIDRNDSGIVTLNEDWTGQSVMTLIAEDKITSNTYTLNFSRLPQYLDVVYLNTENGNDSFTGNKPEKAVQTFEKAKELVAEGGTIYVMNTISVDSEVNWNLKTGAKLLRNNDFTGSMVSVTAGGKLTLNNIILDGNNTEIEAEAPIINVSGGELILEEGAVLQNNTNTDSYGGGVIVNNSTSTTASGTVTNYGKIFINNGKITNNKAKNGGAGIYVTGQFNMTGGEISHNSISESQASTQIGGGILISSNEPCVITGGTINNNSAKYGGGIQINEGNLTITGGEVKDNHASGNGAGIYMMNNASDFSIGGNVKIYDTVSFESQKSISVISDLTSGVKVPIKYASDTKDKILIKSGADYHQALKLTDFDFELKKGYEAKFNEQKNEISMTILDPFIEMTLDRSISSNTVTKGNSYSNNFVNPLGDFTNITKNYIFSIEGNESINSKIERDEYIPSFFTLTIGADETAEEITVKAEVADHPELFDSKTLKIEGNEKYQLTVSNSESTDSGTGSYKANDTVTIKAGTRSGYTFDSWTCNDEDVVITDIHLAETTIIMPANAVTITANWKANSNNSNTTSKPNGIVEKKEDTYYYIKGKPADQGFILLDEKEKLVDKLEPSEFITQSVQSESVIFVKADKIVAKHEWIILNELGEIEAVLPIGNFLKQYDKKYKVYLADENGELVKEWTDVEGNKYYFNDDYTAKYQYWTYYENEWYLFDEYSIVRNRWVATTKGRWYYLNAEGKMVRNQWIDGCWIDYEGIYHSPYYNNL